MNVIQAYKKQGGKTLLIQYLKSGVFHTAVNQFLVLGRSRTALEILRLSVTLKTKNKLAKKYKKDLLSFDRNYSKVEEDAEERKIWFCWLQGIDKAPELVKACYKSLTQNMDREVILITKKNIYNYVSFPDHINEKYKKGIITDTHLSDLLRLELLTRYGGTWIDSTVLCTSPERDIPKFYLDSKLFMFQNLKPGRDGHATYISSWFMTAEKNNKILQATKYLLYKYWENNNSLVNYFLLHIFISMVLDYYEDDWNKIVPINNATPHTILLRLFDDFNPEIWHEATRQVPFHKLTYKLDKRHTKNYTFYDKILGKSQYANKNK